MNLLWTQSKRKHLTSKKRKKLASGCNCLFVPLTDRTALKIYNSARDRNWSYRLQKKAHALGIGPSIGDKVAIREGEVEMFAIRNALVTHQPYCWFCPRKRLFHAYVTEIADRPPKGISGDQLHILTSKMASAGFATGDISHWHNTGLIKGQPVCIDFDPVSMGS